MGKKRDFYYIMPGTRSAALKRRRRNRIMAFVVGLIAAGVLGTLLYLHYSHL